MRSLRFLLPALVASQVVLSASTAHAQAVVDLVVDALDPQACNGSGCWTNHIRVTDLDGDGDLDILLVNYPDFFQGGSTTQPLVVYENDGAGNFTNVSNTAVGNHAGTLRQVAVGDIDGDGDVDLYAPSGNGAAHVLFVNDGAGVFTNQAATRLPTTYPRGAAARMGDVDGDGDLDIFAADGYAVSGPPFGRLYLNDGAGVFTEAVGAIPTSISGADIDDVEFLDVDRDFDLDLIVNAHTGGIGALWLNDGQGQFTAGGTLAPPATSNFHYNVTPCDVDGDGDLDLWVDNIGGGFTEQLQINDGQGNFSDQTSTRVSGNPGADDNGVLCVDIDDDGDFDAVVLSLGTPERLLVNDGAGNFTYVAGKFPGPTNCSLWGEFGDLNGDGRLDLVTGQGECSSSDEVYFGNASMPVDTTWPTIIAVSEVPEVAQGGVAVVRFAVSDSTVTDEGPRLERTFVVLDPDGASTGVPARFVGGDLFHAELPTDVAGTRSFLVCADDPAGHQTCSTNQTYVVSDGGGVGGGPGAGGGSSSGPGAGAGGNDTAAGSGGGGGSDGSDDGCSCSLESRRSASAWYLLPLVALVFVVRRRRTL
jgi:MYXO-CTERM domain-containing protein